MTRSSKFIYNALSSIAFQIITIISGFIIPKVTILFYGSEANGLVNSITQIINYFSIIEAGLATALIFSLYKPLYNKDNKTISIIVSTAKKFYIKTGKLFSILVLIMAVLYPLIVKASDFTYIDMLILILILGLNGTAEFFLMSKYRVLLTADQKSYIISNVSIISTIFKTVIIFVLSYFKLNIILVRFLAIFAILIRVILLSIYIKKNYPNVTFSEKSDNKYISKRWDALFLQLVDTFQVGLPILLATFILGLTQVSIYSVYYLVISGINVLLSVFINGIAASFGSIIAEENLDLLNKNYKLYEYCYMIIISLVYFASLVLIMPFIKLYTQGMNDANYYLPAFGILFVLSGYFQNIRTPLYTLIVAAGKFKETKNHAIVQCVLMVVFGIVLTYFFGLNGLIISLIISNVYRAIMCVYYVPKNILKNNRKENLTNIMNSNIRLILLYIPFLFIHLKINSYISWCVSGVLIVLYSIIIISIYEIIINKKDFFLLIDRILKMIKKIINRREKNEQN